MKLVLPQRDFTFTDISHKANDVISSDYAAILINLTPSLVAYQT